MNKTMNMETINKRNDSEMGPESIDSFNRNMLPEMEFKEFKPRFKSAKTLFKLSAGLNLLTFDTILSGTNHI